LPKFFSLPDLAKILVKTPILCEEFDQKKRDFLKSLERLGKKIGRNKKEVREAVKASFLKKKEQEQLRKEEFFKKIKSADKKIILISHPYNLYDEYVNLGIKRKLEELGAEPIFIDEIFLSDQRLKINEKKLDYPKFHWEFADDIMKRVEEILNYNINGVIEISAFQCGSDAVLKEFIEKKFRERKIPFLYLIIDEQSGEAGFQTRLEAFIDTLK